MKDLSEIRRDRIEGYKTTVQHYLPRIKKGKIIQEREVIVTDPSNPLSLRLDVIEIHRPGFESRYKLLAYLGPAEGRDLLLRRLEGKREDLEGKTLELIEEWQGTSFTEAVFGKRYKKD